MFFKLCYNYHMKHKGFTVVELLVVIVVVGILAAITIVSYSFLRDDAMDTKIKSVVKTAGDAMLLYESKNPRPTSYGYFQAYGGLESNLVPDYLKRDYRDGLSSKNSSSPSSIFQWYSCGDGFVIYASLNNPSSEDIASMQRTRTACGNSTTQVPETGSIRYNYAQTF